jgi:hypothetical protein
MTHVRQPLKIHFDCEWLQFSLTSLSTQNRPQSRFAATFAAILGLLPRQQKFRSFSLQKQFLEATFNSSAKGRLGIENRHFIS